MLAKQFQIPNLSSGPGVYASSLPTVPRLPVPSIPGLVVPSFDVPSVTCAIVSHVPVASAPPVEPLMDDVSHVPVASAPPVEPLMDDDASSLEHDNYSTDSESAEDDELMDEIGELMEEGRRRLRRAGAVLPSVRQAPHVASHGHTTSSSDESDLEFEEELERRRRVRLGLTLSVCALAVSLENDPAGRLL